MEKERTIEILVILIFGVLLLLAIIIVTGFVSPSYGSSTQGTVINNYYTQNNTPSNINSDYRNTGSGNIIYPSTNYEPLMQRKVVDNDRTVVVYKNRDYWDEDYNERYNDDKDIFGNNRGELEYSSYSRHLKEKDTFGSYIEQYNVYVKNTDSVGGYFEVMFNFEDCYGEKYTEALTKYIKPRETMKFNYMDMWYKEKDICNWDYSISS
jgi:hypothetical protein